MKEKIIISLRQYQDDVATMIAAVSKSGLKFDGVYGVPRGGYLPAIIASSLLGLPILTTPSEKTLIIDDIVDSGSTMEKYNGYHRAAVYVQKRSTEYLKTKFKDLWFARLVDGWVQFPDEKGDDDIEDNIKRIIEYIGENPNREGLVGTPDRIIRMWGEIYRGYDVKQKPKITTFPNDMHSTDIVFDTGDYYSMCEHHMMPFFGKYYFAYIPNPNGRILGISKIARVVGYCSAKLQLQEKLAREIVEMLSEALNNEVQGMAIVMKGKHLCKTMRGVKSKGDMSVAHLSGVFKEDSDARREFYRLIELNHG